ncbi:hypothetical protein B0T24DRAFT_725067 [Lasiosphaeria ovina]|uniref:Uncharacterized protein n=1 Tax=Lasiosphaeria ovina TaxID=92902 RepID=A0AAE0MYQ8_9PEZI|nr:hypothetical protein B0T24DRAFT_725067 [Lasiosphaeria ovina]
MNPRTVRKFFSATGLKEEEAVPAARNKNNAPTPKKRNSGLAEVRQAIGIKNHEPVVGIRHIQGITGGSADQGAMFKYLITIVSKFRGFPVPQTHFRTLWNICESPLLIKFALYALECAEDGTKLAARDPGHWRWMGVFISIEADYQGGCLAPATTTAGYGAAEGHTDSGQRWDTPAAPTLSSDVAAGCCWPAATAPDSSYHHPTRGRARQFALASFTAVNMRTLPGARTDRAGGADPSAEALDRPQPNPLSACVQNQDADEHVNLL